MVLVNNELRLPASDRLANVIAERVESGKYKPGDYIPTERELAAEFRANRSTVRAALSTLADRNIVTRIPGHRSRVCARSSSDNVRRTMREPYTTVGSIALLCPQTPDYPAFPAIQRSVLQVLSDTEAPYNLKIFDNWAYTFGDTVRKERQALESIKNEGIRGLILWHQGSRNTVLPLQRLKDAGVALVLLDRTISSVATDFVGIDNVAAAKEATRYLLSLGHRRIMHLTMYGQTLNISHREQGYRDALREYGIRPRPEWIYRVTSLVDMLPPATQAADYFLSQPELPTAIFALNDHLANALMSELQARGYDVPGQISIMGFDDMDRHGMHPSPLTTVHQPFELMGQKAIELMLNHLAEPKGVKHRAQQAIVPTRLVIRTSCREIASE